MESVLANCAPERLTFWNRCEPDPDGLCVVHWMARSQRAVHNLALDVAIDNANERGLPLLVLFNLTAGPIENEIRHVAHMLKAFPELAARVQSRGAAFAVRGFGAGGSLSDAFAKLRPALVVTDDDAMPKSRDGRRRVAGALGVPLVSVDADVVVPSSVYGKREYAARTIRPRIHRVLDRFEHELGSDRSKVHTPWKPAAHAQLPAGLDLWHGGDDGLDAAWVDRTIDAAKRAGIADTAGRIDRPSGMSAARRCLTQFVDERLDRYADRRNHPDVDGTSHLSVFLHYGQISPHEVLAATRSHPTFVEEFVVRRELAWNYVLHTPNCREWDSLPDWARHTLEHHAADERPAIHTEAEMRAGETRDPLWNAAQLQMVEHGTMHGYLRMYWAKQILTWTKSPKHAFDMALKLHDHYSMDGRDANSIVGVSWAIGGVHDRAWPERDIFGKVRSMTFASTGRKFDSKSYIRKFGNEPEQLTLG